MQIIKEGLYEQLINKLVATRLNELDKNHFYIKTVSYTHLDVYKRQSLLTEAGTAVMKIYEAVDISYKTAYKEDNSPVTDADLMSNKIINALKKVI